MFIQNMGLFLSIEVPTQSEHADVCFVTYAV